jgi:hypothetical protein
VSYFIVNDNVNIIYYWFGDSVLGCGKGLWISGKRVGICYGVACGKVFINIKVRKDWCDF